MTKFSINLNKFALIRNSRGHDKPNLLAMARRCIARGAHGITVHPRPDQRHTRYDDVPALSELVRASPPVEFNVEGNPIPAFVQLVLDACPHQVTLVPDADNQLTSDHGWDAVANADRLTDLVKQFAAAGIRTSLFMDPDDQQIEAVARTGADRIELYTGPYADAFDTPRFSDTTQSYAHAAQFAQQLGLGVNAGHDLSLLNLGAFLRGVPNVLEVSIGHALVCESFDYGLEGTIDRYLAIIAEIL
jgi:pyridoxine 5-phosphate synthase